MDHLDGVAGQLQRVVDDLDVRRTIADYAALVDARDWDRLTGVFAADVEVEYHNGRTRLSGAQPVVDYIRANTAHLAWQHHLVSVYGVDLAGNDATAQTYLISHQMIAEEPTQVLMMAATYDLGLRRGTARWQISRMVHTIKVASYHAITASPPGGAHVPPAVRHDPFQETR